MTKVFFSSGICLVHGIHWTNRNDLVIEYSISLTSNSYYL